MQEILNYKIHSISEDKSQPSQKDTIRQISGISWNAFAVTFLGSSILSQSCELNLFLSIELKINLAAALK